MKEKKREKTFAIFVDDWLVAAQHEGSIKQLLTALKIEFQMILRSLNYIFGIIIFKLNNGSIFINQSIMRLML